MPSRNEAVEIDGQPVREGTSVYDTEYDRVLWVTQIDNTGLTVEPVTEYEVERPAGWPPGGDSNVVTEGSVFSIHEFESFLQNGRFEISP